MKMVRRKRRKEARKRNLRRYVLLHDPTHKSSVSNLISLAPAMSHRFTIVTYQADFRMMLDLLDLISDSL